MIAQSIRRFGRALTFVAALAVLSGCAGQPPQAPGSANSLPQESTVGERAADIALRQVGTPYRYGGNTPDGFDCSGLVHYSYRNAGFAVPRTTGQLWRSTVPVTRTDLRAGDVLFFSIDGKMAHVGMYVGDSRFVHAPKSGRAVSVESLRSDFYAQAFIRGGRPE